ncbi:hypothetical protein C4579_02520 [Candidatus Microgenomates bacterium]|nr:MAG: hypothetical protein C4579_02520 [Candidatus Microgenomates bacterium]
MSTKSIAGLFLAVIIIVGLAVGIILVQRQQDTRQRAAAATTLSLSAPTDRVMVGDEIEILVNVNTGTNQLTGADITITFDNTVFQGVSFVTGPFVETTFIEGNFFGNLANIVVGSGLTTPKTGTGTLAILRLKALQATSSTQIAFSNSTAVSAVGESNNVLQSSQNLALTVTTPTQSASQCTINFAIGVPPSPTPTPTPTPSGTPIPTPSATPTPTPTATPAPTPSGTPVPSPSPVAQCVNVKMYQIIEGSWVLVQNPQTLLPGDTVYFAVLGSASDGIFDMARFRVNGLPPNWTTTTQTNPFGEFYIQYTLLPGVASYSVEAEVHHVTLGWR